MVGSVGITTNVNKVMYKNKKGKRKKRKKNTGKRVKSRILGQI